MSQTAGALSSVEFLRSDEIVTDSQFNQAVTPLVLSVVLLVLLTAVARFSSLPGGISMHFPTVGATVFVAAAAGIYISVVPQQPETIAPASGAILIVGAVLAWFFRRMESWSVRGREASVRRRIVSLSAEGYRPVEVSILAGVPVSPGGPEHLRCTCWSKKGRLFIDDAGCRSLQEDVRNRWKDLLLTGRAQTPLANRLLTRLVLRSRILTSRRGSNSSLRSTSRGNLSQKHKPSEPTSAVCSTLRSLESCIGSRPKSLKTALVDAIDIRTRSSGLAKDAMAVLDESLDLLSAAQLCGGKTKGPDRRIRQRVALCWPAANSVVLRQHDPAIFAGISKPNLIGKPLGPFLSVDIRH
ncbi:MAG TPA: hypothetical protein VGO66_07380 [Solirubrobacterales bacterium]|nr:hypothetical protein [Solirubrobacterales bacterium]